MAAFSARRAGYLLSICCHLTPMTTVAAGGGAASRCRGRLGQLTRLAVVPRVVFPLRKQRQEISVAGCDRPDRSLVKLLRRVPPGSSFDSAAEDLCRLAVLGSDICSKVIASRPYGLAATATDRTATATARTAIRLGYTGSAAGTRSNTPSERAPKRAPTPLVEHGGGGSPTQCPDGRNVPMDAMSRWTQCPCPDGQRPDGQRPDGQRADGQRPDGQRPNGQ